MAGKLPGSAIQSNTITITQIQTTAVTTIVNQSGPRVSSLIYPGNDTAGNTVGGQTVYINGAGFETNNAIYINGNAVPSKSFISASNISFTTPALSAGIYPVYVINTDSGATAIFVPGYISSAEPSWVTSAGSLSESQDELTAWSYSLSATGDAPITYALAVGSSLPTGVSLAANGLISGTITSPSGNATTYTFSVVATDAQNQDSTRQFTVTTATSEGVLFANNVLLIHADGTNNQNNHTFLDSSNNNFTITRANNATQGSFSPFSQTGWSGYFDGNGDYLQIAENAAFNVSNQNFTIESWVNFSSVAGEKGIASYFATDIQSRGWVLRLSNANSPAGLRFVISDNSGGNVVLQAAWTPVVGVWYHVAVVRNSTTLTAYVNGTSIGSTTISITAAAAVAPLQIGTAQTITSSDMNGYISNIRIIKGTALYTTTFTPPTAPLAPIANTSLLTLQSNRFVDEGPNSFTITRAGDVSVQSFSPFSSGLLSSNSHSVYFDGTGDYLTYSPGSTLSSIGTGPLTIEAWVYYTGNHSGFHDIFVTSTSLGMLLDAGKLRFYGFSAATAATNLVQNTWVHVAVVRQSSNVFGFIGGTKVLDTTTNVGFSGSTGYIGSWTSGTTENWPGYISNLRVSNSARYTANFTPSTTQFTSDANTALLTCQSATVIDNSPNAFTITRNGDARPRTFNPFGQTFNANIAYSTANVGGGAYFDGTGDTLETPSITVGTNAFCFECWFYPGAAQGNNSGIFVADTNNGLQLSYYDATGTGGLGIAQKGVAWQIFNSNGIKPTVGQWNHIAFVRSGTGTNQTSIFLNGTRIANGTVSYNYAASLYEISTVNAAGTVLNGYMSGARFTLGSTPYDATQSIITVPTSPPTNIANTSLLLNFTNAGIFDQTAKNIFETVGDAKVSTAQYKYGTGSVVFDGTGDYLIAPSKICDFGTGNFTVEGWIRVSNTTGAKFIADSRSTGSDAGFGLLLEDSTGYKLRVYRNGGYLITSSSTISSNTWYHVAFVRNNSNSFLYIDGTQVANSSDTNSYIQAGSFRIGAGWNNGDFFNGYIDDLRITKGYARYTSNFTPPTSALKDK